MTTPSINAIVIAKVSRAWYSSAKGCVFKVTYQGKSAIIHPKST